MQKLKTGQIKRALHGNLTKNFFRAILVGLLLTFNQVSANGKAAFASKSKMIKTADTIAQVNILEVKKVKFKGKHWTYSQKAIVKPLAILKGELDKSSKIYGGENFICASVKYKPGTYLLFLKKIDDYYVGNNWHMSVRPCKNNKIQWFSQKDRIQFVPTEKSIVFSDIASELKKMTNNQIQNCLETLASAKQVSDELIGEGGTKSKDFGKFLILLRDKQTGANQLEQFIKSASPAGKIYLSMVLMKRAPDRAKATLSSLTTNRDKFEFQSGCEILSYTVGSAAKELLSNGSLLGIDPLKL